MSGFADLPPLRTPRLESPVGAPRIRRLSDTAPDVAGGPGLPGLARLTDAKTWITPVVFSMLGFGFTTQFRLNRDDHAKLRKTLDAKS